MGEWKEYIASSFCSDVTDGTHDSPRPQTGGHFLITSKHLKESGIDFSSANKISEEDYQKIIKRSAVDQYDILFSMIGTVGTVVRVQQKDIDFAVKNMGIFKMGGDEHRSLWLYYWLKSPQAKEFIHQRMAGSTQSYMTLDSLRHYPIQYPGEADAIRIASILKSLDDKIEVNRRINENLEQQAQALFKSWLENNCGDEATLSDIADFISGYSYKGTELKDSTIAMATIKNFDRTGGFKLDGFKEIVPSNMLKDSQTAQMYDILVAHTDLTQKAEVIGNAEMLLSLGGYERIVFSMDLVKVEPKEVFPYRFILAALLQTKAFKSHCLGYVNGTTVLHLNKKALPDFVFEMTSDTVELEKIDMVLAAYYHKKAHIIAENSKLSTLRDTLLPKLMSGEIDVMSSVGSG